MNARKELHVCHNKASVRAALIQIFAFIGLNFIAMSCLPPVMANDAIEIRVGDVKLMLDRRYIHPSVSESDSETCSSISLFLKYPEFSSYTNLDSLGAEQYKSLVRVFVHVAPQRLNNEGVLSAYSRFIDVTRRRIVGLNLYQFTRTSDALRMDYYAIDDLVNKTAMTCDDGSREILIQACKILDEITDMVKVNIHFNKSYYVSAYEIRTRVRQILKSATHPVSAR